MLEQERILGIVRFNDSNLGSKLEYPGGNYENIYA
jgi:hypothetical protein